MQGLAKWRRRESNENERNRNLLTGKELTKTGFDLSGYCQETKDSEWLQLSSIEENLRQIIELWPSISPEYHATILAQIQGLSELSKSTS